MTMPPEIPRDDLENVIFHFTMVADVKELPPQGITTTV
jgi:hypothetical protein